MCKQKRNFLSIKLCSKTILFKLECNWLWELLHKKDVISAKMDLFFQFFCCWMLLSRAAISRCCLIRQISFFNNFCQQWLNCSLLKKYFMNYQFNCKNLRSCPMSSFLLISSIFPEVNWNLFNITIKEK